MSNRYFSYYDNSDKEVTINLYGDITPRGEDGLCSEDLVHYLEWVEADTIHVYINSYGGDVKEGLAIYNALKRHKAKIITYAEGFVCSIASVIFMAGDERIVSNASALMIHDAWVNIQGNARDLRKKADDLETITQASVNAYMEKITIEETILREMMINEEWITPQDAVNMGFATSMTSVTISNKASQSVRKSIFDLIYNQKATKKEATKEDKEDKEDIEETEKNKDEKEQDKNKKEDKDKKASNTKQMFEAFFNAIANSK